MQTVLSPRQSRFVDEYLLDANGTQAAIRAGYSASGARVAAHRLLTNVAISSRLEARQKADATRLSITRENVLQRLLDAFEMAREQGEPATMVSAARELGKLLGFYAPVRVEATVDVSALAVRDKYEQMSDAELLAVIGGERIGNSGGDTSHTPTSLSFLI